MNRTEVTIAIRTNAGSKTGIGHLVRILNLCSELKLRGLESMIFIDHIEPNILNYINNIETYSLWSKEEKFDSVQDANHILSLLKQTKIKMVIVDDYRSDYTWESILHQEGYIVVAIDDLMRKHNCDLIVDMKWRGNETKHSYDNLIPKDSLRLLGPDFCLLSPEYKDRQKQLNSNCFNVIISLGGGGGDIGLITDIIRSISSYSTFSKSQICLQPVIGPCSNNCEKLLKTFANDDKVQPVIGEKSLYKYYKTASLFIGATGGSIYELMALQIPAITFSIAANQQTDSLLLNDIGQYLYLPDFTNKDTDKLAKLFWTVYEQYPRVQQLYKNQHITIDGLGASRVSDAIHALLTKRKYSYTPSYFMPFTKKDEKTDRLGNNYAIRKVEVKDINHYLYSRNLNLNRKNMIKETSIKEIDHYCWWFNNNRESYLLTKDGISLLYIWHEKVYVKGKSYLIGGWFVCGSECSYQDALIAVSWQLSLTDKIEPDATWIAVISRNNSYVKALNDYMRFKEVEQDSSIIEIINTVFPQANSESFYYVYR